MKIPMLRTSSLLAAVSILGAGCSDLTPLQNAGVFGAAGGATAGGIARASGASVGESVAIGAASMRSALSLAPRPNNCARAK